MDAMAIPFDIREKFREISRHKVYPEYGNMAYVAGIDNDGMPCELIYNARGEISDEKHIPLTKIKKSRWRWAPWIALAASLFLTILGINHFNGAPEKIKAEKKASGQVVQSISIPETFYEQTAKTLKESGKSENNRSPGLEKIVGIGWPCESHEIRDGGHFGDLRVWEGKKYEHKGVDILADTGSPVFAAAPGRVKLIGAKKKEGKYIIIEHELKDKTTYTEYMHLKRVDVNKGDSVQKREQIGTVGMTGNAWQANYPHLHFGIADDDLNNLKDPLQFLPQEELADICLKNSDNTFYAFPLSVQNANADMTSFSAAVDSSLVNGAEILKNEDAKENTYVVKEGDNLWKIAEGFGVPENSRGAFIEELVGEQSKYSGSNAFIERMNKTAGNLILLNDQIVLSEKLAEKYQISGENLMAACAERSGLEKIVKKAKTMGAVELAKRANKDSDSDIFAKYALMRSVGSNLMNEIECRNDFNNIVERTVIAYNLGVRPSEIAKQSSEAILQNADDIYKTLASGLKIGCKLKGRFNHKIADASGDLDIITKGYVDNKSYKTIAQEFTDKTGMGISQSSIYRILKSQNYYRDDVIAPLK